MTNNPPIQTKTQNLPPYYYEDEISLVDLWLVLVRQRWVIAAVVILCVAVGLIYAFSAVRAYQFSTTIEIGTRIVGTELSMVEPPEALLAKIQETYIPLVRQNYLASHSEVDNVPKIEARVPKGSQIIVLSSKGPEDEEAMHTALQKEVVERVKQDHGRIIEVIRKETEIRQHEGQSKLDELMDGARLISARESRLADLSKLLGKQAEEARSDLEQAKANRQQAVREVTDESRAMTLLMLDSDIQQLHQRLAELDERQKIEIADSLDMFTKDLADNNRAQANQKNTIAKLDVQLVNLKETRAILEPMRSLEPVGPGRSLIIALAIVLGVMLGIFAAFFVEFLAKVRAQSGQAMDT